MKVNISFLSAFFSLELTSSPAQPCKVSGKRLSQLRLSTVLLG
jgi:hypothetical protein